jgi:LCP family protein required for cell wall assembly
VEAVLTSNPEVPATQPAEANVPVTPVPSPAATVQPLCGGPAAITMLVVGSDQRGTGYLYGLADSIYAVHIDFLTPKVMVIDFPRDLWVEIPGIADHHGITHGKINQAYLFGNPGMGYYDGPGEGPGLLARTLEHNFGLRVERYLAIDMHTFIKMIDAVGGVDINVEEPIDLSYSYASPNPNEYLDIGMHHLNGEQALVLATNRIPSTFQRMKYQRLILTALRDKLSSPAMLPKLPLLVAQFLNSVQTDFSLSDINSLICLLQQIPQGNIQAASLPQEMFTARVTYDEYRNVDTFTYEADFDQLREMMNDFMGGTWPIP